MLAPKPAIRRQRRKTSLPARAALESALGDCETAMQMSCNGVAVFPLSALMG
jgi:hypothetical protein